MSAKNPTTKPEAQKAPSATQVKRKAAELAAVIAAETAVRDSSLKARDASAAAIRCRFTACDKITADDLLPVYPDAKQAKTRQNRASDLNAAMGVSHLVGAANAEALLVDALTYGSRLRDDWAAVCATVKGHMTRITGTGTAKAAAIPEAMRATFADLKAARALSALRETASAATKAASKAEAQAESAARYVARLDAKVAEGQDVADQLADAEAAAAKASKAAKDARRKADAAAAKLPAPTPKAPPTVEAAVQNVKVAMGERDLPLAALGAIARDLVAKCNKAGAHAAADLIGKAAEMLG